MAEIPDDYRLFAGRAVYPRSVEDLLSLALCPACQSALTSSTACQVCSLDLLNPAAKQLTGLASTVADILNRRLEVIGRIRWESAQAGAEAAQIAADSPPFEVPLTESVPLNIVPQPLGEALTSERPPTIEDTTKPRRSSVQVLLLIVGISLLSIAAIFFLVYAFITFGLVARSIIVGAITVASIVAATVLRRRGLPSTGEGISVFAVVLIYLDSWALLANDFFGPGSHSVTLAVYWGWTFVITAVLLVGWARLSAMRTPSIVGFAVFPIGLGLLVGSLAGSHDSIFLAFTAIALAGILHRAAGPAAGSERVISFATTIVALLVAAVASFSVAPGLGWGVGAAFVTLALVAVANVTAIDVRAVPNVIGRVPGVIFAGMAAILGASATATVALQLHNESFSIIAPTVVAVVIALALEAAITLGRTSLAVLHLRSASIAAAAVAAIALFVPLGILAGTTAVAVALGLVAPWSLSAGSAIGTSSTVAVSAAIAFLAALTGITASWTIRRRIRLRLPIIVWAIIGGALVLPAVAHILWVVLLTWLLLAVLAVVAMFRLPRAPRVPLAVLGLGAAALAYCTGWASEDTWAVTSIVVICLVLIMRRFFPSTVSKASLLGIALSLAIIGAGATARNLALPLHPGMVADAINAARATGLVAILLLALAALVPLKRITDLDRRVTLWITGLTMLGSVLLSQFSLHSLRDRSAAGLLVPEFVTGLVVSLFLLVALSAWLFGSAVRSFRIERAAVAVLIAPAIAFVVDSLVMVLPANPALPQLTLVIAATVAAALSLALAAARPAAVSRLAVDLGMVIIAVPGVVGALVVAGTSTWLVFEIAAVGAILVACGPDGLFGSASPRKQVGWLALPLATAGLWWWLVSEQITAVEPWVLPLSGVLLLVALFAWVRGNRPTPPASGAAPWIAFAALVISIVPLALQLSIDSQIRPIVIGAISAIFLLAGAILSTPLNARAGARREAEPFVRAMAQAGWIGVMLVSVVQALGAAQGLPSDPRFDLWVGSAFVVLLAASLILVRSHRASQVPLVASEALIATALLELVVLEPIGMTSSAAGFVRALVVTLIFCAAHALALVARRTPFTSRIGWISISFAAIVGIVALSTGAFSAVEWVSVPAGLALLVTGAAQLRWVASSRSWPWLAPGITVLLVPSLLTTAWDPTLWRLVGLGAACVAIIAGSVLLKLQSPFIIASVVVLIHAIATFAPQIAAVYQAVEWWVWLAAGGIIIVILSIRFEKSRQSVKRVVTSVGGLR